VQVWLVLSCLFGIAFCIIRAMEFATLNVRWDSNAYGSVVWLLLGLHTTHIVTDLIDTIVLTVLFFTGPLDGKRYADVSENSFYWYFVVATWIPIYLVIYWGARTT
jgi:cytochrome c oxidase subunit III